MAWQDLVISIVNILFGYALIPQVYQGFKYKKSYIHPQTGGLNALGMYVLTFGYFSLNLTFSYIIGGLNATMWLILFIQAIIYARAK